MLFDYTVPSQGTEETSEEIWNGKDLPKSRLLAMLVLKSVLLMLVVGNRSIMLDVG